MIIYKATNKINNKIYIGKTISSLKKRKIQHIKNAKEKSSVYFSNAIHKHGIDNFEWEVLSETDSEKKLNAMEKFYIACYKKMVELYNLTDGGDGLSGYKHKTESIKKMSDKKIGHFVSEETRKKWSTSQTGRKFPEAGKKLSLLLKGKKKTKETRNKMSEAKKKFYEKRFEDQGKLFEC